MSALASPLGFDAVVVGRGGQGTKLAVQILGSAAAHERCFPLLYSVYDGLIRGGNIASTVVIATDGTPASPICSTFGVLVALHGGWFDRYYPSVGSAGTVFYHPAAVTASQLHRSDVDHVPVDFVELARSAGDARAGSMAAVGVLSSHWSIPTMSSIESALREVTPAHRADRIAANLAAIQAGRDFTWQRAARGPSQ